MTGTVVIGGGVGGVATCRALRDGGYAEPIVLVCAEPELPYDRPPLSKRVLTGAASPDTATLYPADWYAEQRIDLRLGVPAVGLRSGLVTLADRTELAATTVVLATGGRPRRLSVPGADHPAIRYLRTRQDAVALRDALRPGVRLLVVGGGLIGAEAAASAVELRAEVTLLEPDPLPLAKVVGPLAAGFLHGEHASHGVRVEAAPVSAFRPAPAGIVAELSDGQIVTADVVLVGIGLEPDVDLAVGAGLDVDGGILVGPDQRTSSPDVYAVGDAARQAGPDGPLPRIEHWHGAQQAGIRAAAAILGTPPPVAAPWFWSDRYGTHLQVAGFALPEAEAILRGTIGDPAGFSVFFHHGDLVVGAATVNRPLDCRAAQRLIDRAIAVDPAALADESVPLRQLVKG